MGLGVEHTPLEHGLLEHALLEHAQLEHAQLEHGGALDRAEARWGKPGDGWLDLSTGINPRAYPVPSLTSEDWARLPLASALANLLDAAAEFYGAPPRSVLVAAPGSQALIQMLPRLRAPGRVAILGPTYAEHAQAWRAAGHDVETVAGFKALADADVVVLVHPNNPDGRVRDRDTVLALAAKLARRGGWLVVDEAFADVTPEISLAGFAGRPGLVILKSFGKFFGLAGLRLGFALGDAEIVARLRAAFGPWPVAGPAIAIAAQALRDRDWIAATWHELPLAAAALDGVLREAGLEIVGGTALFRLVRTRDAASVADRLGRRGILVREFAGEAEWLRFGLPGDAAAVERLRVALLTR